jgi:endonuclease III
MPVRKKQKLSPKASSADIEDLGKKAPPLWKETLSMIKEARAAQKGSAPVDTDGCERQGDEAASPEDYRFQTLIACMLSSQTKDPVTADAVATLKKQPGGLTVASMLATPEDRLDKLIGKVGFHRNKARFIKNTVEILRDLWSMDIPDSVEGLVALPGVGPKMAHLTMNIAWGIPSGICVDVHVHRISNRLGWVKTKQPEETRLALEQFVPEDEWIPINPLLVGWGQTVCTPINPDCGDCPVRANCKRVGVKLTKAEQASSQ